MRKQHKLEIRLNILKKMLNKLEIDKLIPKCSEWLNGKGRNSDIIISSRTRLARNLKNTPFPNRADKRKLERVVELVKRAVGNSEVLNGMKFLKINNVNELDKEFLVERHLISPFFAKLNKPGAIFISEGELSCIMINEEDHLRIQWIRSGLDIDTAWDSIRVVDNELNSMLDFAFSDELGYLTACPSNTGNGLRVSFFCHLPGIVLTKNLDKFLEEIVPAGIAVRGFYGEGTDVQGNIFQVSNQVTLGITEKDTIERIKKVAKKFIQYEKESRNKLLKDAKIKIEDKVYRAKAIMQNAKIIPSLEFMSLLSAIRLGVELKMLKKIDRKILNELMVTVQSAHIQKLAGKNLTPLERDILRAEIIKDKINF